jgi:hypothetical protein
LKLLGVHFIFGFHDLNPELYNGKLGRRDFECKLVCWTERMTFWTTDATIATDEFHCEASPVRGKVRGERTFDAQSCLVRRDCEKGQLDSNSRRADAFW